MKIYMISFEDGITATGFRRIAACVGKINEDYRALRPTFANQLLYVLRIWRPPRSLFDLKHGEFTAITGKPGYLLLKLGIIFILRKIFVRPFERPADFCEP